MAGVFDVFDLNRRKQLLNLGHFFREDHAFARYDQKRGHSYVRKVRVNVVFVKSAVRDLDRAKITTGNPLRAEADLLVGPLGEKSAHLL